MRNRDAATAFCIALFASLIPSPVAFAACEVRKQTARAVVAVLDGETIKLDDGREVKLLGVLAPAPPPALAVDRVWEPAEASRKALSDLLTGKSVRIAAAGRQKDRYGRTLAHVFLVDGKKDLWIGEWLVEQGHTRVATSPDHRTCIAELITAETNARRAKRGLWAHAAYQIRDAAKAHELADFVQSYQIVEGRVREIQERKRRVYLDFGEDWSKDLTAIVSGRDRKRFETAKIDLMKLKGVKVRLRGWVERWNGPLIRLSSPEQIEVLEALPAPEAAGPVVPGTEPTIAIPIVDAPDANSND